ncbi:MAG TPA: type II toxin-antitoxin system prevent-host-death family antitoxin [Candidatus Acidoferrum sp.]|jgi:prevent-host-death family protein
MIIVSAREAQNNLNQLIKKAHAGEEIIITRSNKAVARLIAFVETKRKRRPGSLKGKLPVGPEFFEPLSSSELKGWE